MSRSIGTPEDDRAPAAPFDPAAIAYGPDGLVPVVVQDRRDGRVLMQAWADAEAVAATLATGDVHFHSRSRGRLWKKGESSGHVLHVVSLVLDCDGDAILAVVDPVGPTCHRETRSCFDPDGAPAQAEIQGFTWLEQLWETIADRVVTRPAGSYTARLLDGGVDAVGRKVTEEATEVLLAAKDDAAAEEQGVERAPTREALAGEAADLVYHALVLLAERGIPPADVIATLQRRHGR